MTETGIGSGRSVELGVPANSSARFSIRTSPERSARVRPFPGERVAQHVDHVEHEEAPAGPVQGARLDLVEVGHHGAEVGPVLDASDEVVVGRVALHDHGRAAVRGVVDEDVDAEALEVGPLSQSGEHRVRLVLAPEVVEVVDHLLLHGVEVREHLGKRDVPLLELLQEWADREQRDLSLELPHLLRGILRRLVQAARVGRGPLLDLGTGPRDPLAQCSRRGGRTARA